MNPLDRVVSWLSPRAGAERVFQRYRLAVLEEHYRRYDAAALGRRNSGWVAGSGSANAETHSGIPRLRNRSRELVRNNSWARKAVNVLVSNIIGPGIVAKPNGPDERVNAILAEAWKAWAGSTEIDPRGKHNFGGLQALAVRSCVEGGETLARRRRRRSADRLTVPLQLQLLEPDHIDSDKTEDLANGDRIVQGVQFDPVDRPRRYWLFQDHPGELGNFTRANRFASDPVTANSILHPFNVERIGQVRGVPWGASCLVRLRDFDDYTDAQLVRQKLAACFVGFVHDPVGTGTNSVGTAQPTDLPDELTPGLLEQLPPGKQIQFSKPPEIEGFKEYADVTLHEVAAGFCVTYESLSGDLAGVNFSAGRMGWIEFFRAIVQWREFILRTQFLDPTWRWFNEAAIAQGLVREFVPAIWTPPRREMIDPVKEVGALQDMVRSGFSSLSEAIRQLGYDPRQLLEELRDDQELLRELGLTLDTIGAKAGGDPAPASSSDREDLEEDAEEDERTRAGAA